ncbi:MAG: metal ABC transporter ATP-binding protein [Armatimonadota bacterium]
MFTRKDRAAICCPLVLEEDTIKHQHGVIDSSTQKELVSFEHACLGYGKRRVIDDLSLVVSSGDFLGIVGQNGCGKTTILKAMLGILKPLNGHVHRDSKTRFGYVPQRQFIDEAYPLTALEVVMMGRFCLLGAFGRPTNKDRAFVLECLNHVGIADLAHRPYRELSGGQKQRSLIARALATEPQVLILDEPTNDMDIGSEHTIMELLNSLHINDGLTIVIVSHLLNVLVNYAKRYIFVDGGIRMEGISDEIVTSIHLSEMYGVPVEVVEYESRKVVLTGGPRND